MNIKKLRELKKNKKGFTLIEIIVVVVILAVLMAVAVPSVMKYMNEADDAKYMSQTRGAYITMQTDLSKALTKDSDGKLVPSEIEAVLKKCEITGKPTVIALGVTPGDITKTTMPTEYYVKFDNTHIGKLTENSNVEILDTLPSGVTVYNLSTE
ncbi:prepilin-type N-terminal cleavage/methylation domain-containing protein [Longibaculum muris]|uniref:prepilin-type N-terminal cleavage/methylation domain-containing protein n=1 Tax=Longibaculum muris TaxID=1796628 RepID=UPI0022E01B1F|nr:prepilin-type N-terminal cleavage/methylation domain-containing protein [Longibaculum muris]